MERRRDDPMGEDEQMESANSSRLLIYADSFGRLRHRATTAELIDLSAALQRRFPDQLVGPVDLEELHGVAGDALPVDPTRERRVHKGPGELPTFPPPHDYIYLVLAWIGGTVSKQAIEQAVETTADLVRDWMQRRRNKDQIAVILGPDGKVLKEVRVLKAPRPHRWRLRRRHR